MTVVLAYHRVVTLGQDPQLLSVSPGHFAEHLEVLRDVASIVPLSDVFDTRGCRRVAITFDDGYADNADTALPILESAEAPATMFVTEGMVGRSKEFWWDELEALLLSGDDRGGYVDMEIDGLRIWADARDAAGRARLYTALQPRLRELPGERIEECLDALAEGLCAVRNARSTHLPLDDAGLRRIAESSVAQVGAHSVSHSLLRPLPAARQQAEVLHSKTGLEARIGRPVDVFAYPFGGLDAFSRTTRAAVRRAGYSLACANTPGRVTSWSSRFALPRHLVRDWDGDRFAARVQAWLGA